jgi:hypothetical protein
MLHGTTRTLLAAALTLPAVGACGGDATPTALDPPSAVLVTVSPLGGAQDVDVRTEVVVEFDAPMMAGIQDYAMLHRGDVTGPEVPGAWTLSPDRTTLTFAPTSDLEPHTPYTLHLGGGMMDGSGHTADFEAHGHQMGGSWATGEMMGGGMMGGGGMGSGMGGGTGGVMGDAHMGQGWQHPENGSYGMVFTFTTGS